MTPQPEALARKNIDRLLTAAGWMVQDARAANVHAGPGVAIREFPLKEGHGFADYMPAFAATKRYANHWGRFCVSRCAMVTPPRQ